MGILQKWIKDIVGTDYQVFQSSLTAQQKEDAQIKAHNLKEADEINTAVDNQSDLEDMILANTSMQVASSADVLYELDGTALTLEDGTRELKNKALHSDTPNGKLFSGNPLDFQGSQNIKVELDTSSINTYIVKLSPSDVLSSSIACRFGNYYLDLYAGNSSFRLRYYDGTNLVYTPVYNATDSYIVSVEVNTDRFKIYLDGVFVEEIVAENNVHTSPNYHLTLGSSVSDTQFWDGQMDFLAVIDGAISADEHKRFTTEPEKALIDYGTNPDLKALFVTDFSGDSGYISNMCDFDVDENDTVVNGSFLADSDWVKASSWSIANNKATQDGSQSNVLTYISQSGATSLGLNIVSFDIVSISSGSIRAVGGGFDWIGKYYNTVGTHHFIINVEANTQILFAGTADFVGSISNIKVKSCSGIHQIQGYNETQRTNFVAQPTGYQHLLVSKNELGFSDGIADHLAFKQDSLSSNISIDKEEYCSIEILTDANFVKNSYIGESQANPKSRILVGKSITGGFVVWFGNTQLSSILTGSIHVIIVKRGIYHVCFLNGTYLGEVVNPDISTSSFGLNHTVNRADLASSPDLHIYKGSKYKKDFTESEIQTLFKLRQKQFPQLNLGA